MDEFKLQKEEVSGMVKAEFNSFYDLWLGEKDQIRIEGFEITKSGEKVHINKTVGRNSFVPHEKTYYESVVKLISKIIKQNTMA